MAEFKLGRLRFVWKGLWTTGTTYVKDDIVKYGGASFVCVSGHVADTDFNDDLTGNKWQKMSAGIEWKTTPWTPSTVYKEGDIVRYGGKSYISLINHVADSSLEGGFYIDEAANKWDLLSDGQEWKNTWATGTYYKIGDIVKYNSSVYICVLAHESAATLEDGLEADLAKWNLQTEGFKWKGLWVASTRYIVNDVVKYGPNLWLCETAHTSDTEFANTNWTLFVSGLEFEDSWSPSAEYQEGDIVTYGGYSYVSNQQHTNQLPPESSVWELLTTGYNTRGRYQDAQSYKVGDVVNYGGKSFVAEVEVDPGESPFANPLSWQLVSDGIRWLGNWSAPTTEGTYKVGDAVRYGQSTYVCVTEHTPVDDEGDSSSVNRPDQDTEGDFWNALAEGDEQNVLTRRGDLVTRNAIQNQRLPKGTLGSFLRAGERDLEWSTVGNITRVFYVSTDGEDSPSRGTTLNDPFRTIKYACNFVRDSVVPTVDQPAVINVKTGVYTEVFPISLPKFTSLVGDELRMSIVEPTANTSHLDKFYMRDSTTIRNFTFRGATGDPAVGDFTEPNGYGTRRPTGGAWVGLDPGAGPNDESVWVGQRSPYIQNVTTFGNACVGQKIDGALHNGGNKSITSNDFTQVMSDSVGAWCTNQGRAELVSVFTYYSYIGYLCENGGVIRATNGNNSYGTFGSVSEGVDPTEISRTAEIDNRRLDAQVDRVQTNGSSLLFLEYLNAGETYSSAEFSFTGPGSATLSTIATFEDGGVCEVRVLDDGDNYLNVTNNSQQGTDIDIRLSASDTTVTNGYNGMRITLIDGAGAGQYGIINNFDGGSKDAFILKESFPPLPVIETISSTDTITLTAVVGDYTIGPGDAFMLIGSSIGGLSSTPVYYVKTVSVAGGVVSLTLYTDTGTEAVIPLTDATADPGIFFHKLGWDVFTKPRISTVIAATNTNPVRITTSGNHGLVDGFQVTFSEVGGMTQLNGNSYRVLRISNTQFDLYTSYTLLTSVNGTAFGTYTSGGTVDGRQGIQPFLDTTTRYIIEPRPVFSTGEGASATAVRTLGIDEITISDGGKGFTIPPTISIAGPDEVIGNSTATGTVTISGEVTDVVIQSKGTGFTSVPTLAFVGGGLPTSTIAWASGEMVEADQYIRTSERKIYLVVVGGELGLSEPTGTSGTITNGDAELTYVGRVAAADATITSTIKTVELNDGGVGYTSPPSVLVSGTGGVGAIISAQISQVIGEINVTTAGSNYTSPPTVTIVGGDPLVFAEAEAVLSAVVTSITVLEGGSGYIPSTTTVSLTGGSGLNATATPVIDFGAWEAGVTPGVITSIEVTVAGTGYQTPPTVVINGAGVDASAVANITGSVASITVTNRGRGYNSTPIIQITGGGGSSAAATATRTGAVNTLTVVDGGAGWSGTPALSFDGGGGAGASATVTAMDVVIDQITVTDGGENYTSNPALAVQSGGGSNAILRPRINGVVTDISITDPGSDYSAAPVISFIGGNNYKSAVVGQRYYANASALIAIGISQKTQTLAAIERAKVVARAVIENVNPVTQYQTSITRTAGGGGYSKPTDIEYAIDSWFDSIYYTIENGSQLEIASELLALNRLFIKTEVKAFIDQNFSGVADSTWTRDYGLIVDALVNDLAFRGVNNSLTCGISQVFLTARTELSNFGGSGAITQSFVYLTSLMQDIVQNIVVVPTLDPSLTWKGVWAIETSYNEDDVVAVNDGTYICLTSHTSNAQFSIDLGLGRWELKEDGQKTNSRVFEPESLTAISNNLTLIEGLVEKPAGDAGYSTAAALLLSNKAYIKAEVIGFINTTYNDFDYNQTLCARDVGFIVDAVSYDLVNASVTAEPTVSSSTTGVIARITVDEPGEGYSEGVTITITGGTPETTAIARPVINEFTGEITSFTMINKGKGYDSTPTVDITPDSGSGAIARCRLAGSNVSRIVIIEPGSGYSSGPFMKLIDPNNTEDAQFQVRVADGVLGQPIFDNRGTGWLDAEGFVDGNGFADIAQTGSFVYVKSLTNVPTPGANIQFRGNDQFYKLVTVREVFGPDGIIGGRQLLLANKTFIQEEIISYLNNFTYNSTTCERDVGYIIDALSEDIVYGSNARLLYVLQQYRRGTYSAFADQRFQTAFAIDYLKGLISQSQKPATLDSLDFLKTAVATSLSSSATAVTRSATNVDIIIDILDNGLTAVPAIVTPDPTGYNSGFENARAQLQANREFLVAEVIAYITDNYPSLDYSPTVCARDVEYIIDALSYDLTYGGNLMSLLAGNAYYSYTELQIASGEKTATLAAYDYLRTILGDVLQDIEITPLQAVVDQDTSEAAGSSTAAAFAQDRINDIRVTINTGVAPATINPDTTWVDAGLLSARATLLSQKDSIRDSVITYIETNFPTLVFNRATCSRDIGYIIDALGWDVIFGSNFQSIKSGMAYYRANAENLLSGFDSEANSLEFLIEWIKNEEAFKPIPAPVFPNGNADTEENNGKDLIIENIEFIGAQGWRYFVNTNGSITVNETIFRTEIEQIALSIAHDLTYTGNTQTVDFASSFYSGSTLTIPGYSGAGSAIKTEYLDLIAYLRTMLAGIVQNSIITPETGLPAGIEQNRDLPSGDAGTAVVVEGLIDDFSSIINLTPTTIGVTVTVVENNFDDYPGALLSARQSLADSTDNLKDAVTDWIDDTFVTFEYNSAVCYRDVGLIVQAIADDVFGDVAKSIEAGQRYYAATAALVLSDQKPQTIAAIDRINTIAQRVIRNETYTRTQNNAFQERFPSITGGGDAGPAIIDRTRIVRRILEVGNDLDNFKQLVLDNKEYIKAEVISYINASYENLDYNQATCARDVGFIIDALVYDIYGGFSRSLEAGLRYYSSASALIAITDQKDATVDGILRTRDLVLDVLFNRDPAVTFQETESRILPSGDYDVDQVSNLVIDEKITAAIDQLLNVIDVGPSALPAGLYRARLQVSPPVTVFDSPSHETPTTIRSKYSQVRLTGHDFLNIGTGNKSDTNYPGLPVNVPDQQNEVVEVGGGRVFYTSTDQDGNFRVGELFRVEQSTGIATLNADAFNLSGLNELSLGGITLGGTNAIIREFSTDATFFANSDSIVPTQKAIKTYIQSALGSGGGNIAVNAVIAGQVFVSGDEITTIGNIPLRLTTTGGHQILSDIPSTDPTNGSLTVLGGVGIQGDLNVSGSSTANLGTVIAGSIENTPIGVSTRNTAAFTTLTANSTTTLTANTASDDSTTGALVVTGGVGIGGNLNVAGNFNVGSLSASGIDNTPIGAIGRSSGAFTTLGANGQTSLTANIASSTTGTGSLVVTGGIGLSGAINIGGSLTANGANVSMSLQPTGTGTVTINPATAGTINNMSIGASTRSTGAFTTLTANGITTITNTTASTTVDTGALQVDGGVGINGNVYAGGAIRFTQNVASTTTATGTLVVTGGVGVSGQLTAATLVETSSIVFKENINPIDNALDAILHLTGVLYDRKDGSAKNEAGLIAEEVNKYIPEIVTKDKDGNPYGIAYTKLTAYLIESIKSLKAEIDDLKGKK